jgi:hypothetical protein
LAARRIAKKPRAGPKQKVQPSGRPSTAPNPKLPAAYRNNGCTQAPIDRTRQAENRDFSGVLEGFRQQLRHVRETKTARSREEHENVP